MIASVAIAEFEELAAPLERLGAHRAELLGRPVMTLEGRMFACLDDTDLAVRLGRWTPEYEAALDVPGASIFSPGTSGRTFNDWVELPLASADVWHRFAIDALSHVMAFPARR
ncbi:hypothetical protein ACFFGH_11995 [Lysobacter korlensis]|uniref:TfoX N-terminal domain-containing protein n=1 Tax=Lysobacter korlensis TaxID=553636 RepID=A0ABV6RNK4_9GAMM